MTMASQKEILKLVQTILNDLCQEFKSDSHTKEKRVVYIATQGVEDVGVEYPKIVTFKVKTVLRSVANGKCEDLDGLSVELLKWGGDNILPFLTKALEDASVYGFPQSWSLRKIIPIHKSGRKDVATNYRTIMVGIVFAKVFGKLLESKLNTWTESFQKRSRLQAGFRPTYSAVDHVLVLRVLWEKSKGNAKALFCAFIDFKKAFDTVFMMLLWERLHNIGVPCDILGVVTTLYNSVQAKINTSQPREILSTIGVIQGCTLSPTLFGIFIDGIERWLDENDSEAVKIGNSTIKALLYADDIVLLARDATTLQKHLNTLANFCTENEMEINLEKSKIIIVGTRSDFSFCYKELELEQVKV
ncbi:hypothetical protein AXG93_93s1400 [Marchantia polymorpha subsp. ruderalis]|uniref:Reverse transcriptase domain-containing protein n=1 Tax=Marchantia polymorpha subsp. ruderalis TaxID=1480154 RepID=A0A176WTT6_MARPO|nr:hypothetical protein AXG93_93s1400 [Marchantia polymorpha subsp. ruderalis]